MDKIYEKYTLNQGRWCCNKCGNEIYSGKKKYKNICKCIDKKEQHGLYISYLKKYYTVLKNDWICKECDIKISSKREMHAISCKGFGTRRSPKRVVIPVDKKCDMGCGCPALFLYKNGKSYCCKLGAKCPVKVEKDSKKKIGINPFLNKEHPRGMLGKRPFNKGLTKETSLIVAKSVLKLKETNEAGLGWLGKSHTQETKDKLSLIAKKQGLGGFVKCSGRGKKGWYNGIFCDSSWELAFLIYHLDNNIKIERCTEVRKYEFNGAIKKYYPDFVVKEKIYEIKGYKSAQWEAKHRFNSDVICVFKEGIQPYLNYVINKYGKDFIRLYEKNRF